MADMNQPEPNADGTLAIRTFPEPVADFVLFDVQQDLAFTAIGRIRSPFAGVSDWPWLEVAMRQRSQQLLASSISSILNSASAPAGRRFRSAKW
jgi:hypothetical protein